jgi:hypothetical protein
MPNWSPNWNDVRWNWAAADAAVAALHSAAGLLDATADERARVAREAQAEWRGLFRDRFDGELTGILDRGHALAAECRAAAGRVASASNRAREEQRHRERERARWRREKEEDRRRDEERRRHR